MHKDDTGIVENGDIFINRKNPSFLIRKLIPLFTGFGKAERFIPDIMIEDGYELKKYGINGKAVSLPGHSKGSVGLLLDTGELFCGDLFDNVKKPELNSIMDEPNEANASFDKLK
jgi:glyoxylase-like metal-dependent hydrolase (beta-lactamase superfamily II)